MGTTSPTNPLGRSRRAHAAAARSERKKATTPSTASARTETKLSEKKCSQQAEAKRLQTELDAAVQQGGKQTKEAKDLKNRLDKQKQVQEAQHQA